MKLSLKSILLANALFSGISGLILAVFYEKMAVAIDLKTASALVVVGIALLVFSLFLFWLRSKDKPPKALIISVIIQDALWVLGSAIVLLVQPFGLNAAGHGLIAAVAVVVLLFAVLQWKNRPAGERFTVRRSS